MSRSAQLSTKRSRRKRRRVEVQVVARGIVDDRSDLVWSGGDTARSLAVRAGEVLVVKEINPVWPLTPCRGDVEVKGGDFPLKSFPINREAGLFSWLAEVEFSGTLPVCVAALWNFPRGQLDGESTIGVLVPRADLMRCRRGRPSNYED